MSASKMAPTGRKRTVPRNRANSVSVSISWLSVETAIWTLHDQINKSKFKPDYLFGIPRGGLVPAAMLGHALKISGILSTTEDVLNCLECSTEKILIVDDIADHGDTLLEVKSRIAGLGGSRVKVATLHKKPWSVALPDFFAIETEDWIVYPWELNG